MMVHPSMIYKQSDIRVKQLSFGDTYCSMGISVTNEPMVRIPHMLEHFVVSWILSGKGCLFENDKVYPLAENTVCVRRPDHTYRMELYPEQSIRLFLDLPDELYHAMLLFVPELGRIPPVSPVIFRQELHQEFINLFTLFIKSEPDELSTLFGTIQHFVSHITGISEKRKQHPLYRARSMLDDVTSILQLEDIASQCGMNYHSFRRAFTEEFGISPGKYRCKKRMEAAYQMLLRGEAVQDVALQVGYTDVYTFTHRFTAIAGCSPTEYRDQMLHDN